MFDVTIFFAITASSGLDSVHQWAESGPRLILSIKVLNVYSCICVFAFSGLVTSSYHLVFSATDSTLTALKKTGPLTLTIGTFLIILDEIVSF